MTMKHSKALLAVDLVQMAILQGLVNERVNKIDADKQDIANNGVKQGDALEANLIELRDTLHRVAKRQLLI
jgi:hypothetical protein